MKKLLLGTTALAAVSALSVAATSASAQTLEERIRTLEESMLMGTPGSGWDVQVTGYLVGAMFITDHDETPDEDLGSTNIRWGGGELQFLMSTVLDNGMEVGGRVELENVTAGDQIDETYIYVEGGFGQVKFGADDAAPDLSRFSAPWFGLQGVDGPNWRHINTTNVRTGTGISFTGDANKITYFTPRFSGFQFGISYTPDGNNGGGGGGGAKRDRNTGIHDVASVGATFARDLGGFDMGVSAGYETGSVEAHKDDPVHWNFGGKIGAQGFTLGAAYYTGEGYATGNSHSNGRFMCGDHVAGPAVGQCVGTDGSTAAGGDNPAPLVDLTDKLEQNAWSIGVTYGTGPWTFGTGYFQAEGENFPDLALVGDADESAPENNLYTVTGSLEPEDSAIMFYAGYNIGPGVNIAGDLGFFETKDGKGTTTEATGGGLILGISF